MSQIERSHHSLIARLGTNERIAGYYRYVSGTRRRRSDGQASWHVRLSDRSGVLDTYVPYVTTAPLYPLPTHQRVYAEFRTHRYRDRLVGELMELDTLVDTPDPAAVVDQLPCTGTPLPKNLDHLAELLNGLTVPSLRHFADRVLARDDLVLAWIEDDQDRFTDAVTAADIAAEMPYFQAQERDLIVVGALFRDLGAVVLQTEQVMRPRVPTGVLTIERCASGLAWLEQAWPYGAGCLRQIWAADMDGEEASVLGHAVGLMAKIAQGDVSGTPWLASRRRIPQ